MRVLLLLLLTGIIGLTCGPNVTETQAVFDDKVRLSGIVVYVDSQGTGAPEVWVVYGFEATDSTDRLRLDSAMTDTLGEFLIDGAEMGDIFWDLYREPRRDCYGGDGSLSVTSNATNLRLIYTHRPTCDNFWPPDSLDTIVDGK